MLLITLRSLRPKYIYQQQFMTKPTGVICIGEILIDLLSNEPDVNWKKVKSWTPYTGGAPANVAFALASLGLNVAFAGRIGADSVGFQLHHELKEAGIDTQGIQIDSSAPTRQVFVERNKSGERFFAGFGKYHSTAFADTKFDASQIPAGLFDNYNCLLIGTLLLPYSHSKAAIYRAVELAKENGILLAIDINWRPVFWNNVDEAPLEIKSLMKEMDLIKLSEEEATWLFDTRDPKIIASEFPNARVVLVSKGEEGCNYYINSVSGTCPSFRVNVVDTTGAGDSFMAGFLHQYLTSNMIGTATEVHRWVQFACAIGALCTAVPGAISAKTTVAKAKEFLNMHT